MGGTDGLTHLDYGSIKFIRKEHQAQAVVVDIRLSVCSTQHSSVSGPTYRLGRTLHSEIAEQAYSS